MIVKLLCTDCGTDIKEDCVYCNDDGYFCISGTCHSCNKENSVDMTDIIDSEWAY